MTGLSQYTHFMYIPRLYKDQSKIQQLVHSFWEEKIASRLSFLRHYIIDFVINYDNEDRMFTLIELNPFHHDTNGTLYRWDVDNDELHKVISFYLMVHHYFYLTRNLRGPYKVKGTHRLKRQQYIKRQ